MELLTDELLDELSEDEPPEPASVVSVFPDLDGEDDVVVGSIVTEDGEVVDVVVRAAVVVVGATVVVVVVVVGATVVVVVVVAGVTVVVVVVGATVVVVVVVVVGGALDVTTVREPVTVCVAVVAVYVTTYAVLAVKPETFAKNSVGHTGLLLLLKRRPFEVPLPEPTVTPSFLTVHEAVIVNGVVPPVLSRHPFICI